MKIHAKHLIFSCFLSMFLVFFFQTNLKADNKEAKKYHREAERYIKKKEIKNAVIMMGNAIKSDPTNGYYDFYTGYIYLYKTENKKKALEYLESAESKGYTSPLLYRRKGMCYFHLKQFHRAIEVIEKSITLNMEKLEEAEKKNDRSEIKALNKEIANSYVWLTKLYDALNMPLEYHKAALLGYKHNPNDHWLPGLVNNSWLPLGHYYFAEKKYDKAAEAYKNAEKNGAKWSWLSDVINIVKRLKRFPKPNPIYVHKIALLYVKENIMIRKPGHHVISDDISEHQIKKARQSQKIMKQIVELFSEGKFTVEFEEKVGVLTFNEFSLLRRTHPDHLNLGRYFYENMNNIDTFVTMSNTNSPNYGIGNFGGSRQYPYINGVSYGPPRGMLLLSGGSGFSTLLHEFFHTLENLANISPSHGFRQPNRFPDWKGKTELDYYEWHFKTTLKNHGWKNLNFKDRYRRSNLDINTYEAINKIYNKIELKDRQEANVLVLESENMQKKNMEYAVKLYEQALELSPYHPKALRFLSQYFLAQKNKVLSDEYNNRLTLIKKISDYYPNFDIYTYYREVQEGVVVGKWAPNKIDTSGTVLSWDISKYLKKPGQYNLSFLFNKGQKAVTISWAALYENDTLVHKDSHRGWSGNSKRNIVYRLALENRKLGAKYIIKAKLKGEGGNDSCGDLILRKVKY